MKGQIEPYFNVQSERWIMLDSLIFLNSKYFKNGHVTLNFTNLITCFFFEKGLTYDHVELNIYLNGKNMHCPASGIRGTVYPVVYGK